MMKRFLFIFSFVAICLFCGLSTNVNAATKTYDCNKIYSNPFKKMTQYKSLKKKNAVFKVKSYTSSNSSVVHINKAKGVMNPGQILTKKEGKAKLCCIIEYRKKKKSKKKKKTLYISIIVSSPTKINVKSGKSVILGIPTFREDSTLEANSEELTSYQSSSTGDGSSIPVKYRAYKKLYSGDYTTYTYYNGKVEIPNSLLTYENYVSFCKKYDIKQFYKSDKFSYYVYGEKDTTYTYNTVEIVGISLTANVATVGIYAKKNDYTYKANTQLGKSNGYIVIVPIPKDKCYSATPYTNIKPYYNLIN